MAANLILTEASVRTMDPSNPTAEAIAVAGNKILAVGSAKDIAAHKGPQTKEVALEGRMVMPAFIEGHAHLMKLGQKYLCLNAEKAKSWDEILEQVKQEVARTPKGQWIYGRGWHQSRWDRLPVNAIEGLPTNQELDLVAPDHPVILTHNSGHILLVNSLAIQRAGVDKNTPDPEGGDKLKLPNDELTGIFRETAREDIYAAYQRALSMRPAAEIKDANDRTLNAAIKALHSHGIATFHDMMTTFQEYDFFLDRAEEGNLGVRVLAFIHEEPENLKDRLASVRNLGKENWLKITALKRFMDGAFGSNTALMLEPYDDKPGDVGLYYDNANKIRQTIELAAHHDLQMAIHAIGDRAVREVLDHYEYAIQTNPLLRQARWRLEHAAAIHPDDLPRFNNLGVLAPVQGSFVASDADFLIDRLGESRCRERAYVFRTMQDMGIALSNGTDAPIEDIDPFYSLYSTVTRKRPGDEKGFFPEQGLTVQEALESYTIDAAYSGKEEQIKGSLEPGKLADIAVLSHDIVAQGAEAIPETEICLTLVDGRVVYES